jgi:hypothetical protein
MMRLVALFLIGFYPTAINPQEKKENKQPAPRVIVALPLAVEMGKTARITLRGQRLDSVSQIQVQEPKSTGKVRGPGKKVPVPNQANVEKVGDSEVEIEITVSKEAPGSVVPFVVIGPGGESKPHQLIIKDCVPIVVEKEPNDGFKQAQPITLPCAIEGSIRQAQDVDAFRFEGKRGDRVVFDLQANRFGSPLDGILTLYDADGRVVASADDSPGSLDPILEATLPGDGTYYVALIDAHDQGGSIYVYRLVARSAKR